MGNDPQADRNKDELIRRMVIGQLGPLTEKISVIDQDEPLPLLSGAKTKKEEEYYASMDFGIISVNIHFIVCPSN